MAFNLEDKMMKLRLSQMVAAWLLEAMVEGPYIGLFQPEPRLAEPVRGQEFTGIDEEVEFRSQDSGEESRNFGEHQR